MSDQTTQPMNLDNVDAIVLLDKSGSMNEKDGKKMTRWVLGQESIGALAAELAKHDDDGITVVPFGEDFDIEDGVTPDKAEAVFANYSPGGGTYLAPALQAVIDKFLPAQKETKPATGFLSRFLGGGETGNYVRMSPKKQVFIAIYTDGAASDEDEVIEVISDATKRITGRRDLGILFIQVGDDPEATEFLERLNNGLEGDVADFDIVAVTKLDDLEDLSTADIIKKAFTE